MIGIATFSLLAACGSGAGDSTDVLCVSVADEKFGLGTSRMSEIPLDRVGRAGDMLI